MSTVQQALAGLFGGDFNEAADSLKKALEASNGATDTSLYVGGEALGMQSLDTVMKTTIQENNHFVLFNKLQSTSATNIVDQFTTQKSVGGFLGGSFIAQGAEVRTATGEYKREIGQVKLLSQIRAVGHVLESTTNMADPIATEENNGALGILTDAEFACLHGSAAACPVQFDGVIEQIKAKVLAGDVDGDHIIDMQGASLSSIDQFAQLQAAIKRYGSWGSLTDAIITPDVQADINNGLDPAFRWMPDGNNNPVRGGHVDYIRLAGSRLQLSEDTFLMDDKHPSAMPFQVNYAALATANAGINPVSVTVSASSSDAASQFDSARAGSYYYAVASIDHEGKGMSQITKSTTTAVAAGKKAVLTITASSAGTESGYAVYRSRMDGTNDNDDFRLMCVVPKGGATTTYTDLNRDIPGTSTVICMNMNPSADAIGWRQLHAMSKIPLAFGLERKMVRSWFQFMYGYLRITKPRHHGIIKNIVPANALWKPFG